MTESQSIESKKDGHHSLNATTDIHTDESIDLRALDYVDPPSYDPLNPKILQENCGFMDDNIRRQFVRKVYLTLTFQLTITLLLIIWFVYYLPSIPNALYYLANIISIVVIIALACFESRRRKSPLNYICLSVFTLVKSIIFATIVTVFHMESVIISVGATAILCFGLTLFAIQTKWNFTIHGGCLFICFLLYFVFAIAVYSVPTGYIVTLMFGLFGAFLFTVYLICDTHVIMGGYQKYPIYPEEYVFASLNLYLDIFKSYIFVYTLFSGAIKSY